MNILQGRSVAVLVGLGIVASLSLTGCSFGGPSGASGGSTPEAAPTASGSSSEPLEGFEGKPANFPSDIPLIDGEVVFGIDLGTGWTVVVETDDIVAAYGDAESKLTSGGFSSQLSSTTDDGSFGVFDTDKYTVQVTAADSADYGPSVTYVVVLKG